MKRYLKLYKQLLVANWTALLEYRADLISRVIASLMFSSYHVITVLLLTYNVPKIFGWTRNELLLLASTYSVFISIYHMFISRNLDRLADEIYYGRLDSLLLKPLDSQITSTLWIIDFVPLIRLIFGALLSVYFLSNMQVNITLASLTLYAAFIILGVFILYSLWLPFICLLIFNPRLSNIVSLLFQLTNFSRYPREMYAKLPVYIFASLIPLALIMTTPTKILIHKFSWQLSFEFLLVAVLLGVFARVFWKFSLKHYTSASS